MKATEKNFTVMLFFSLYEVVLILASVDESLFTEFYFLMELYCLLHFLNIRTKSSWQQQRLTGKLITSTKG